MGIIKWVTDPKFLVGAAVGYFVLTRAAKPLVEKFRSLSGGV